MLRHRHHQTRASELDFCAGPLTDAPMAQSRRLARALAALTLCPLSPYMPREDQPLEGLGMATDHVANLEKAREQFMAQNLRTARFDLPMVFPIAFSGKIGRLICNLMTETGSSRI